MPSDTTNSQTTQNDSAIHHARHVPMLRPHNSRGAAGIGKRRILVISGPFPSCVQPTYGVFVKERIRAVANLPDYDVRVVSPVPYFPPLQRFPRWYTWSQFPRTEVIDGLPVHRPRYFQIPKVGHYCQAWLMYRAVRAAADYLRHTLNFDFDLIDSHFAYPSGVVATRLGALYRKPVVITGRGEDMQRFPNAPVIGKQIQHALQQAAHCIAVSQEIAASMKANGADPGRVSVIPNGVDCDRFHPQPRETARAKLGLPTTTKIILSVGDCFENKGFHLLVKAIPQLRQQHSNILVVIVGGSPRYGCDYTEEIRAAAKMHQVEHYVYLAGRRPHEELADWYNAADVFALLSAREGSPNVLMEALACGIPAVATPVGGIPEVLSDPNLGILLPERSVQAAATALTEALSRHWDHSRIRATLQNHGWNNTAVQVHDIFETALNSFNPS